MKNYFKSTLAIIIINFAVFSQANFIIGFGSCLDQNLDQPIWTAIHKEQLDAFFFLGDNVYGDSRFFSITKLSKAYEIQKNKLPDWLENIEILQIWDDHDYGLNDGGKNYRHKEISQEIYLNFWKIPQDDQRRNQEGVFFSKFVNHNERIIQFIGMDTRYHRSNLKGSKNFYRPNTDIDATILGEKQWLWLKDELDKEADIKIIASSIQVLAKEHRFEKWSNFPDERFKLLSMLSEANSNSNLIIISGDRHRGGIYKKENLIEVTSSSMNKPSNIEYETDKYLDGKTHPEENYGIIEITDKRVFIYLKNIDGKVLEKGELDLKF